MNKIILCAVALIAHSCYGQMGVSKESTAVPAHRIGGYTTSGAASAPMPQTGIASPSNGAHKPKKEKRTTPPPAKNGGTALSPVQETRKPSPHVQQPQSLQQNVVPTAQDNFSPYLVHDESTEQSLAQPCPAHLDLKNHKTYAEVAAPAHAAPTGGAAAAVQLRPALVREDESRMTLHISPAGAVASPSQQSSLRFAHEFVHGSEAHENPSLNPMQGPRRISIASGKKSSVISVPSAAVPGVVNSQVKKDDEYQRQLFDVHQQGLLDRAIGAAKRRYINKIKQNTPAKNIADMAHKQLTAKGKENTTFTQEVEHVYRDLFFLEFYGIVENYKKQFPEYVEQLKTNKNQIWEEILEHAHRGCCVIL